MVMTGQMKASHVRQADTPQRNHASCGRDARVVNKGLVRGAVCAAWCVGMSNKLKLKEEPQRSKRPILANEGRE